MSQFTTSFTSARQLAIATLLGSTLLAGPWIAALAASPATAPIQLAQAAPAKTPAAAAATSDKAENLEQRITTLHAQLKITPDEDSSWNSVAQAMRENAANMEKLVAEKHTQAPQSMTALDNLQTYQEFAQAHVDGLKNLTASFKSLYTMMPDDQKKNADQVFQNFHHANGPARG